MILDPTTSYPASELPQVLRKFYGGAEALAAEGELHKLLNSVDTGTGVFGDNCGHLQEACRKQVNGTKFHVDAVLREQSESYKIKPHDYWMNLYGKEYPTLKEIAIRVLTISTQSADVERCCKVNKLLHTKERNRLKNQNVVRLISCYVNLRLLNRMKEESGGESEPTESLECFLSDTILDQLGSLNEDD